jgi:ubiquinone/menaquinone biosynthesis C-methylase UbiE
MVEKARANARLAGVSNVETHECEMARLPLPGACADVVISNASINLSPDKTQVFSEAFRIPRSGGRILFADVVRDAAPAHGGPAGGGSCANCLAGTLPAQQVLVLLRQAGFAAPELVSLTDYRTSATTIGALPRGEVMKCLDMMLRIPGGQ